MKFRGLLWFFLLLVLFLPHSYAEGSSVTDHSFGPQINHENWTPEVLLIIGVFLIIIMSLSTIFLDKAIENVASKVGSALGTVLLAFASSLPLVVIAITAAFQGETALALTTIIVTNIANLTLVLGSLAFFHPLKIGKNHIIGIASIFVTVFFIFLLFFNISPVKDAYVTLNAPGTLTGFEGLIIMIFFAIFILVVQSLVHEKDEEQHSKSFALAIVLSLFFGIVVSWTASQIVSIFIHLGTIYALPDIFLGTVLVVVGTSLPEFAVGFVVMSKGQSERVFRNLITSVMVNMCLAVGFILMFRDIIVNLSDISYNIVFLVLGTLVAVHFLHPKYHTLTRNHGLMLLGFYILYLGGLTLGLRFF